MKPREMAALIWVAFAGLWVWGAFTFFTKKQALLLIGMGILHELLHYYSFLVREDERGKRGQDDSDSV